MSKIQELKKRLHNIDWIMEVNEDGQTLEETAIKKVFIDDNPFKKQISSIWNIDINDNDSLYHFKNNSTQVKFEYYFKKLEKLQGHQVSEKEVESCLEEFVDHLKECYGESFNHKSIPDFAKLYIDNEKAKKYLLQYGDKFNVFLFQALMQYYHKIKI